MLASPSGTKEKDEQIKKIYQKPISPSPSKSGLGHITADALSPKNMNVSLSDKYSMMAMTENRKIDKKRLFDGTSERELMKAMSTFLNVTGAGDYTLPSLTGKQLVEAGFKNSPSFSFKRRSKLPWHPNLHADFVGQSSPPSTVYSPVAGRKDGGSFPTKRYSIGRD